ncbi:MAG: NUDIX hydrolase, partial [Alphaproteobacteria bacterium]
RAPGVLVAAIRETFEETGLLLADDAAFAPPPALAEAPLWRALGGLGRAPALGRLAYVARAITPTLSPRRFNTRFFMADAAYARGELVSEGELLDLRWVALADVARILPVVDVTQFVLATVAGHLEGRAGERVPLWRYVGNRSHVLYE